MLDCSDPRIEQLIKANPVAGALPSAVVREDWTGSIAQPGGTASIQLKLPRGRWDVSLQYVSTTGLEVSAPGLARELAPNYMAISAFWPAGTLTSNGRTLTLAVKDRERSWFGKLIGAPYPERSPISPGQEPLWRVAFTRHGATPHRIAARHACGRYVDWVAPAGSSMR